MKKTLGLLCLFSLLTAFTCDNEPVDDGIFFVSNNNEELLGTWNLLEFDITSEASTTLDGQTAVSNLDIVSINTAYVLEFTDDLFTTQGSYSYALDVVLDGDIVSSETYTLDNVMGEGTYFTNENQITIEGSFFEFDLDGIGNSILQGEQTANFEISDNGQILTFTQNETIAQTDETTGNVITTTISSMSIWSKEELSNTICNDSQIASNEAEAAFSEDDTNEDLCDAYKMALENQIITCGDADGSLQAIIDDLGDCSFNTVGESGTLVVTVGTLLVDFINQNVNLQDGIITVNATNSGGEYSIYFEVVEGATGIGTLQNFVISFNGTEYFPSTQGVDDFESNTTVSSQGILIATFNGLVESNGGADLSLTQGMVDVPF